MAVEFTIIRATGQGEQTQAKVELELSKRELSRLYDVYAVLDARCYDRNQYLLDSMRFMKKLPIEAQMGLKECVNILYGQSEYSEVIEKVLEQQDAYKAVIDAEQAKDMELLKSMEGK